VEERGVMPCLFEDPLEPGVALLRDDVFEGPGDQVSARAKPSVSQVWGFMLMRMRSVSKTKYESFDLLRIS
jgi:hypothetical protein